MLLAQQLVDKLSLAFRDDRTFSHYCVPLQKNDFQEKRKKKEKARKDKVGLLICYDS
jgi:hypothetical protein